MEGGDQERSAVGSCGRGASDLVATATGPQGQGERPPLQQQEWGGRGEHDGPCEGEGGWMDGRVSGEVR